MSLSILPDDCLLACLARVPYADLRNAIPSTSKQLRDAVASAAFRKTRESCVEWALFVGQEDEYYDPESSQLNSCYLIQASAAYRTSLPPPLELGILDTMRRASGSGDEIIVVLDDLSPQGGELLVFDPRRNRWREITSIPEGLPSARGTLGDKIMFFGTDNNCAGRHDVYDATQDAWSRLPDLPFNAGDRPPRPKHLVEVDGKLWRYASEINDFRKTWVYDPATQTWTDGPSLPYKLLVARGVSWHVAGFELHSKFCIMGYFELAPDTFEYTAFLWDPTREAWEEASFDKPSVVALDCSHIDDHLFVLGHMVPDAAGPWDRDETLILMLRPGSTHWEQLELPNHYDYGARITAVRIG